MDALREVAVESAAFYIGWGGLLIGIAFGFIVYRTNFCTMGSISDLLSFGDFNRFRAWILAIAVAILGVAGLERIGGTDISMSMYQSTQMPWGGNIIGGFVFGFGMVFSGGCISRNLVRAGSGDIRSVVVLLVTGIAGYMTIGGLLGPVRVAAITPMTTDLGVLGMKDQSIGNAISLAFGSSIQTAKTISAVLIAGALLAYCFTNASFRSSYTNIAAGIGIGLCVVGGWFLTGITYDEFADNPVIISLSYVRPVGDTLDYLMRFTAHGFPGFGIATVAGALLGGFLGASSKGGLRLTTFADNMDTLRNLFGAVAMGIGGVLALGCTVGQGLTGVSTLAIGSVLTLIFIVIGGILGVKAMENFI